jgi:hypothetical protein
LKTYGIHIKNNRSEKDNAYVYDFLHSGMISNKTYPKKYSNYYLFKITSGDYDRFYIAGGENKYFKAEMIEFYGIN